MQVYSKIADLIKLQFLTLNKTLLAKQDTIKVVPTWQKYCGNFPEGKSPENSSYTSLTCGQKYFIISEVAAVIGMS